MNKSQNPTDRFLILQYRKGDKSVLPVLVQRYHKTFCEKAYWITKNKELAKDIAQDCWIVILNKLDTLKNVDSFKSWALRIVYTKAIDCIKATKKSNENLKTVQIDESSAEQFEDEETKLKKALLKAIQNLPKDKQNIIRLFYAEDYSIAEISTFLNIPKGTVKSRLFKAREKLKSLLKK